MDASPSLTQSHLQRSVLAVPPLARSADGRIDRAANEKIIRHIEAGGVSILLYGGNANLYHLPLDEYEPLLARSWRGRPRSSCPRRARPTGSCSSTPR